jgi:hypothetical protein
VLTAFGAGKAPVVVLVLVEPAVLVVVLVITGALVDNDTFALL